MKYVVSEEHFTAEGCKLSVQIPENTGYSEQLRRKATVTQGKQPGETFKV